MGRGTDRMAVMLAFLVIYTVWGSTYMAIRVGLETIPPFLSAGIRLLVAGILLDIWLAATGRRGPVGDREWWMAALTGFLMLVCGLGGVTWAEQTVSSGVAALLVIAVPLWMTILDGVVFKTGRVTATSVAGLTLGIIGLVVLVGPTSGELGSVDPLGAAVIIGGAFCWSLGSQLSRTGAMPASPIRSVAIQMTVAGVVLMGLSTAAGEWQAGFSLADVSHRSIVAVAYLIVFGSVLSLCAYVWLLRQVSATAVATYAFVNPIVAVLLGWWILGEPLGPRVFAATALTVTGVVLIQSSQWRRNQDPVNVPDPRFAPCPARKD